MRGCVCFCVGEVKRRNVFKVRRRELRCSFVVRERGGVERFGEGGVSVLLNRYLRARGRIVFRIAC